MGLTAKQIKGALDDLASREAKIAATLELAGYPEPRSRPTGYITLLRTIVGQQVSVAAAASVWRKLEAEVGEEMEAQEILARDFDSLRACGLSRQKQGYVRSLCELVGSGALELDSLPADDEQAIAELTKIKGIGRWSAEIYLLFAEGRPDIWPAGDLAVQKAVGRIMKLGDNLPSEKEVRAIAEEWRPHRGAMAVFAWHTYNMEAI